MEFIYGLLTAAVFFLCLLFFFYLGTRYAKKPPDKELDEEKKREIEQFNKGFKAVFKYDVETALQRKKVT
jgi:hypothetical protein